MLDKNAIGRASPPTLNEVEKGAIRRFAEALGDYNPIYYDEEYARASGYPTIVAPPTFPASFHSAGGSARAAGRGHQEPAARRAGLRVRAAHLRRRPHLRRHPGGGRARAHRARRARWTWRSSRTRAGTRRATSCSAPAARWWSAPPRRTRDARAQAVLRGHPRRRRAAGAGQGPGGPRAARRATPAPRATSTRCTWTRSTPRAWACPRCTRPGMLVMGLLGQLVSRLGPRRRSCAATTCASSRWCGRATPSSARAASPTATARAAATSSRSTSGRRTSSGELVMKGQSQIQLFYSLEDENRQRAGQAPIVVKVPRESLLPGRRTPAAEATAAESAQGRQQPPRSRRASRPPRSRPPPRSAAAKTAAAAAKKAKK